MKYSTILLVTLLTGCNVHSNTPESSINSNKSEPFGSSVVIADYFGYWDLYEQGVSTDGSIASINMSSSDGFGEYFFTASTTDPSQVCWVNWPVVKTFASAVTGNAVNFVSRSDSVWPVTFESQRIVVLRKKGGEADFLPSTVESIDGSEQVYMYPDFATHSSAECDWVWDLVSSNMTPA